MDCGFSCVHETVTGASPSRNITRLGREGGERKVQEWCKTAAKADFGRGNVDKPQDVTAIIHLEIDQTSPAVFVTSCGNWVAGHFELSLTTRSLSPKIYPAVFLGELAHTFADPGVAA